VLFPTVQFALFFPVVRALSWVLMRRPRSWKPPMVAAGYVLRVGESSAREIARDREF
jgi:hypothetical protein